ncbi:hypothetical protein PG994_014970 [Apiospora phragmitis]|uniref:beta-glucosidase n=1 Tax=Apiospora phragmitis TaxID=2905665 RepID=A0ABR1SV44_9PEZI
MHFLNSGSTPSGLQTLSLFLLSNLLGTTSAAAIQSRAVPAPYVAASYYPAPHGGWANDWADAYEKAIKLVSQMTLAEKTNITGGTGFFMVNKGLACVFKMVPLGVRTTDNVTAFPAGITTGATFDKKLMGKASTCIWALRLVPLGRKPRGGRNWEGFGADPVLQAFAGSETVKGVQDQGVIAVLKHLIGNEQEVQRMFNVAQQGISANIDDRAMHELYLWPFAEGVRAGTGAVMTSYNAVNGSASSQNAYSINGLLKEELGFQGLVMTDWLAHMSGVASALAGLDMSMPGDTQIPVLPGTAYFMYEMTRSALNGSVPMDRINDMATRVVAAWYKMGQDEDYPRPNFSSNTRDRTGLLYPAAVFSPSGVVNQYVNVQADHKVIAKQVAQDAITLLKNNGSLLPISTSAPIKVFGTDAQANPDGINKCSDKSCNKGTLGQGWGSGSADYPYMDDPISSLKRKAGDVQFWNTDSFPKDLPDATADDVALVFISSDSGENSYEVEGNHGDRDKTGLKAWHNGDELVQKAAEKYSNVVVVVHTVGPIVMDPWINLPSVKSVVFAHLPGQEAGDSLTEVLFGEVSPSGHLPYTVPVSEDDYPESVSIVPNGLGQPQDTFSEGIYIDYRYFQKNGVKPQYAFGHGLSYASFAYSDVSIKAVTPLSASPPARPAKAADPIAAMNNTIPAASEALRPEGFKDIFRYRYSFLADNDAKNAYADGAAGKKYPSLPPGYSTTQKEADQTPAGGPSGGNPALWDVAYTVSLTVTNNGTAHAGKASTQLYVQFPETDNAKYDTPPLQLRDFAKTAALEPGKSETVELTITRKGVSVWDSELQNWVVPNPEGRFKFWIGDASDSFGAVCYSDSTACEIGVPGPL